MYLALLPQFISPDSNAASQAIALSAVFIAGCAIIYGLVGRAVARASIAGIGDAARRRIEGISGGLLAGTAFKTAVQ